jgi:hypothetical protein
MEPSITTPHEWANPAVTWLNLLPGFCDIWPSPSSPQHQTLLMGQTMGPFGSQLTTAQT